MKKSIIVVTLVLCVFAGVGIASAGAKPYPDLPTAPAYTSRYPIIDDIAALEARMDVLERDLAQTRSDLRIARDQISVLQLLRAYDIKLRAAERTKDQKRIAAIEWARCGLDTEIATVVPVVIAPAHLRP